MSHITLPEGLGSSGLFSSLSCSRIVPADLTTRTRPESEESPCTSNPWFPTDQGSVVGNL